MSRLEDRRAARDSMLVKARPLLADRSPEGAAPRAKMAMTAAVDLGASKVSCFILKPDGVRAATRTLQVAGVGYVASRGVKGGLIVDVEAAADSIAAAVERAEAVAGVTVPSVTVATAGGLQSRRVRAQISLGARPISDADCQRAIGQALASLRLADRRAIHLLPVRWSVDGQGGVRDPRGLHGGSLALDLLVVSIKESVYQTLAHCVESARLAFTGVVAAPFASALAALEQDELDLGCVCIDMGAGSTSVAVFSDGALVHVDSVAVGGGHVTSDIARGLSITMAGAERLKTLHGSAIASANEDRETIEAPARGDDAGAGPVIVPRSILKGVIQPRVEETLELVRDRLKAAGVAVPAGANIVLTGGASQLVGVREVAHRVFDRNVRLGRPRRTPHLADSASGPAFCAAAGVLQRAAFGPREAATARGVPGGRPRREPLDPDAGVLTRAAAWLAANL